MALSAKFISLILLISLISSQIHARESQFFSKVSHDNNVKEAEHTNTVNNEAQLSTKQESLAKNEPDPETDTPYGLYNQEITKYAPYITTADGGRIYDFDKDPFKQENMVDTKFTEAHDNYANMHNHNNDYKGIDGYDNHHTTKSYDDNYYDGKNKYGGNGYQGYDHHQKFRYNNMANQDNHHYNGGNNRYMGAQKQGMSDTRFLENGRYYYDVSKERYNPNMYDNYGEMSARNEYNNNNRNYYANNENPFEYNKHSMGGYHNQQEEFVDSEFDP